MLRCTTNRSEVKPGRPRSPLCTLPRLFRAVRGLALCAGLAALSACAGQHGPQVDNRVEAQHYAAIAPGHYTAPGPASDPWGPYVIEAASRFDVPQSWIRGVMRQESSGLEYQSDGTLTISDKGAMGLMQVMPETYDELRVRYGLGDDPYDPHNNILAGTAYMRELYDLYGMPAFLAAYNAGPGRLDKYLANTAPLPDETRRYVAMVAPGIHDDLPANRSAAQLVALNQVPINIPPGMRYARVYQTASRKTRRGRHEILLAAATSRTLRPAGRHAAPDIMPVSYPVAHATPAAPALQLAYAAPHKGHGFHLIGSAVAAPLPMRRGDTGPGFWAIQVGAFGNQGQARAAVAAAQSVAGGRSVIGAVHQGRATLYRARLTGLSREAALSACGRLHRGGCLVLSPDAQS